MYRETSEGNNLGEAIDFANTEVQTISRMNTSAASTTLVIDENMRNAIEQTIFQQYLGFRS